MAPKFTLTVMAVALLVMAFLSVAPPQAAATGSVTIRFAASGFSSYYANIITIDGVSYTLSDLNWRTFSWKEGETHSIQAVPSFKTTDYPAKNYTFSSWTNGNGLSGLSGTYTVPDEDTTVTLNYVLVTHIASFQFTGITAYSGQILKIDGVTYSLSDFNWRTFAWDNGTTHTIEVITPITNTEYPPKTLALQNWTNGGSDLTGISGTITMPNNDITITANYAPSSVHITFATAGLSNIGSGVTVLTVDGVNYDVYSVPYINNAVEWNITSTHTVTAVSSVIGWDGKTYYFTGWTNGNGLEANNGTLTTPDSDALVIANYGLTQPTSLTITCNQTSAGRGDPITVFGHLRSGDLGIEGKTVMLSYFNTSWASIANVTTSADGAYSYSWTVPEELENGLYPVKAEFTGDSAYLASEATTDSCHNGSPLFVVPEVWGTLGALLACFGALVIYKIRNIRAAQK
jgi:hypothetical protein